MNDYRFDDIDLSHEYKYSFSVTVTETMMDLFMNMSGDENPLHIDEAYALKEGFKGRVVYGMLSAALYSRLVGMYLPGKYCLLQRIDSHFHAPVYIGDRLEVSGFIKKKVELGHMLVISAQITNQDNVIVNTAKIEVGCLK